MTLSTHWLPLPKASSSSSSSTPSTPPPIHAEEAEVDASLSSTTTQTTHPPIHLRLLGVAPRVFPIIGPISVCVYSLAL